MRDSIRTTYKANLDQNFLMVMFIEIKLTSKVIDNV